MAIAIPHYNALKELHRCGKLPQGGTILEIGEANYYGDLPLGELLADLGDVPDEARRDQLRRQFFQAVKIEENQAYPLTEWAAFDLVKIIYGVFFNPLAVASIDKQGTPHALKFDLNEPLPIPIDGFQTIFNHGTAEHIFNIAQVFRTMHERCAVGGLMIHESPFTGWIDHGFYTLQPTLYLDVAEVNHYEVEYVAVTEIKSQLLRAFSSREELLTWAAEDAIPNNAMLFVALRKTREAAFEIPMQGYYAERLGKAAKNAWHALR